MGDSVSYQGRAAELVEAEAASDETLLRAFAAGDGGAFDLLYARHAGPLYRFMRRLLGVRLAAEVDAAFEALWTQIVQTAVIRSEAGAILLPGDAWRRDALLQAQQIALACLREHGGSSSYYAHDEDGDGVEAAQLFGRGLVVSQAEAYADAAQQDAFWQAAGRRMLACLDEMPDMARLAFLLQQEPGATLASLARAMDVAAPSVRSLLQEAQQYLYDGMARYVTALGAQQPLDSRAATGRPRVDDSSANENGVMQYLTTVAEKAPLPLDLVWQRALTQAPDQNLLPPRPTQQAIRVMAWAAVGMSEPGGADPGPMAARTRTRRRRFGSLAGAGAALVIASLAWLAWPDARVAAPPALAAGGAAQPEFSASVVDAPTEPQAMAFTDAASTPSQIALPLTVAQAPDLPPAPPAVRHAETPTDATPLSSPESAPVVRAERKAPPKPPPVLAAVMVPETPLEPPRFDALSQWTQLRITPRGGESRSLSRDEAGELGRLLGSAALAAVRRQPLKQRADWRVDLLRDGKLLAQFELARDAVRWQEKGDAPAIGRPSEGAREGLRAALVAAINEAPR